MVRWNSHAVAVLLVTLLSMDAVFSGVVPLQRARLPVSDDSGNDSLLGEAQAAAPESPARQARDLNSDESSLQTSLDDEDTSDGEVKRELKAFPRAPAFPDDDFFNDDLYDADKLRKEKQQETASEAMGAVAYVAGAAASFLTRPLINTLPPNFNKAIISFASFINSVSRHNKTEEYSSNSTSHDVGSSRQAREFPAYGFDGAVSTAVAWMKGETMDKMVSIAPSVEELAPYASLRGPDAARVGVVDPLLTVIGVIRRAIATEFLTTAMVMTVAHLARLFFINLPTMLPIFGLSRLASRELAPLDKPELLMDLSATALGEKIDTETNMLSEKDSSLFGPDRVKQAELLAREVVAAVTRDQCAERAACLLGSHCSQYTFTPSVMRLLRSPEAEKDKPDHPVWLAFRDAAEGRSAADDCDQRYKC